VTWRVTIGYRAQKDLDRLEPDLKDRIAAVIDRWATGHAVDYRRLTGRAGQGRIRVGDWRIIVLVDTRAGTATILRVLPRGGAYKL
jgi:mRNA-degrading endonuclease RelE of RelBE toxin-antitoxin system